MNEQKIQELAEQCTVYFDDFDPDGILMRMIKSFNKEKFAMLIVRECADTIQDFVDHRFPASEYPQRLKRYFGVEE